MSLKSYYELAKPRLVYGNAVPFVGGFLLASRGNFLLWPFVVSTLGILLVMGSACVFNNIIDRDIDAKMRRTKHRAVASGRISGRDALVYGLGLGLAGFFLLAWGANLLSAAVAAAGFFFYVVMYSMWWKRRSTWGTAVGSVAGAIPPVAGYAAASGRLDAAACILFALMVAWQMPHFFAIAIRHSDDYAAAGIPALPVVRGLRATKVQMLLYIAAFTVAAPLLSTYGYEGQAYFAVALVLGLAWLALCLRGFAVPDADRKANEAWARAMFDFSLVTMVGLFFAIAVSSLG